MTPEAAPLSYQRALHKQEMEKDPLLFGRLILGREWFKLDSPPFHREISKHYLNRDLRKVNIIAPRGHAKSTLVAGLFPLHHIFFPEKDPSEIRNIVIISKTQGQAESLLGSIKSALEDNLRLQTYFGDYSSKTALKWTDKLVVLKDGTSIRALGTGMQIRGLKQKSQRPTLIVADDLEDENNTKTAEAMEANLKWFLAGVDPAIDAKKGRIFSIGTPLHQRSLVMMLKEMPEWTTLHYSAEHNPSKQQSLWPEHLSWDELMVKKAGLEAIGRASLYYQEYCCTVIADEIRLFKPEYLNYYSNLTFNPEKSTITYTLCDSRGAPAGDPITDPVICYTGVDSATSTESRADYTVILTVAMNPAGHIFVLPFSRTRSSPYDTVQNIIANFKTYNPYRTSIETTGAQETFRDFLSKSGTFIPGIGTKHQPRDRKEARHLELIEPYLRTKRIFIDPSMRDLVDELIMWPKGKHDDILDALYYALLHANVRPEHPGKATTSQSNQYPYGKKPSADAYLLS